MARSGAVKTLSGFEDLFEALFNCQDALGKIPCDQSHKQPITEEYGCQMATKDLGNACRA